MDNSLQMMDQLNKAINDINTMNDELKSVELQIEQKLTISNTYKTYITDQLSMLNNKEKNSGQDTFIFGYVGDQSKIVDGYYSIYGSTLNPGAATISTNVFNYYSSDGSIYKNSGAVKFYTRNSDNDMDNEDYKLSYADILKEDPVINTNKNDVFKTFNTNLITVSVELVSGLASFDNSKFNIIEINPYLPGSFDIEAIRIYTIDQYYKNDMTIADRTINDTISDVGFMRILLDKTYNLYRIEFDINIKYQRNGFPFGIKSLQFLKSNVNKEDSYIILEVDKNNYIASVGKEITLITPIGEVNTTMDKYGIKCYMFYNNGVPETEIDGQISRNITKFYAKIPVKETLLGIKFKEIVTR